MSVALNTRASLLWLTCLCLWGCASGMRGAARLTVSLKDCPELTRMIVNSGIDWQGSLGIEAGDAATIKSGLQASKQIEAQAVDIESKLLAACSGVASDLGAPLSPEVAGTAGQACQRASAVMAEAKAKLGAGAKVAAQAVAQCVPGCATACNASAPAGPCASSTATVSVTGAADEQAALRYHTALEVFVNALLTTRNTAANARGLVGNAKAAVQLGLVTGQAVSDGDAAAAAASALCIVPPLIRAKQNLSALRQDYRTLSLLARNAGLLMARPDDGDEAAPVVTAAKDNFAPALVAPLTCEHVLNLFAFPDGGLAAQTWAGVIALPGGEMLLRTAPEHQVEFSIGIGTAAPGTTHCAVTSGRRVACIRTHSIFVNNQFRGTDLTLTDTAAGRRVVATVDANGSLSPDGIAFTSSGELLYAYSATEARGDQRISYTRLSRSGAELQLPFTPETGALEDLGGGGRANPPITFFELNGRVQLLYRQGRTLLLTPLDQPGTAARVAELSSYDARPVVGGDGMLYVFYYEPKSRTARVAVSSDGAHFTSSILDGRESGWQLEALPTAEGAVAVYYYFRGPSDKGLRAATLRGGKIVRARVLVMREERWNAGWHPRLVSDGASGVTLTYLSNVEDNDRVWAHFGEPADLGSGPLIDPDDDSFKNWFLQVGAGGWYTWWHLESPAPSAKDLDGAQVGAGKYKVDPALLLSANLEARWGPVDLGLTYAQNYLDDASKKLGESTRLLTGSIKIEDLLPGHDVKAEGLWGRYHGEISRASAGAPTEHLDLETSYVDIHLFALNQWRIKYGLGFSSYRIPAPVLAYSVAANDTHYQFAGSALRDVRFNNIDLALGYSQLDYAAKYENSYFGPMLDVTIAGGLTIASFDAIATPDGDVSSTAGLHLRANLMLGWLAMKRFQSLAGLGLYIRPSYAVEGSYSGDGNGRPDDRKQKDADKSDTAASFEILSLRHGPWLDAGIIW